MTKPHTEQADLARLPKALQPLTREPRWVIWKWQRTSNKNGETKWTKVPYRPEHSNEKARNNDPDTWSKYELALSAYQSARGDGIGYNLYDSDIGAFDIDHCRNPETGELTAAAKQLVERANSYTEITVSGSGLRFLAAAMAAARSTASSASTASNWKPIAVPSAISSSPVSSSPARPIGWPISTR